MAKHTELFGKIKPETLEETNLRVCADIAENKGDYELAREFRYANSRSSLSHKARKMYDREVGIVEIE